MRTAAALLCIFLGPAFAFIAPKPSGHREHSASPGSSVLPAVVNDLVAKLIEHGDPRTVRNPKGPSVDQEIAKLEVLRMKWEDTAESFRLVAEETVEHEKEVLGDSLMKFQEMAKSAQVAAGETTETIFSGLKAAAGTSRAIAQETSEIILSNFNNWKSVMTPIPYLNDWQINIYGELKGKVRSHRLVTDGSIIKTSPLLNPDSARAGSVVVTNSGSKYKLGTPLMVSTNKVKQKMHESTEIIPVLHDWFLNIHGEVEGTVSNHPTLDDGSVIVTSALANPNAAKSGFIVETKSGSMYKLGTPQLIATSEAKKIQSVRGLGLTGETAGDGKYMLAGKPLRSPSGRSQVWTAYRAHRDGSPTEDVVAVKISSNIEAMERENANYLKVTSGLTRGMFVERLEYLPVADSSPRLVNKCALVMERGTEDLKAYLERHGCGLEGPALRNAAVSIAQCVQGVHSANLVWTDLKARNFVMVEDPHKGIAVKGIDLESAFPVKSNPIDYTPEACPPEFALSFLNGEGESFVLEKSYDIWSFGMVLWELSTGYGFFDGSNPLDITRTLSQPCYTPNVECITDPKLRDLIAQCLQSNPRKRPNIAQILLHPYFLMTGNGHFSFLP